MATMQHKIFGVREFIKTKSATAMQRAFHLLFNNVSIINVIYVTFVTSYNFEI